MSSKSSPEVRGREKGETSMHRPVALGPGLGAWSPLCSLFCMWILYSCFVAIYNISYVSLTMRTRVTPKEGAAACLLPCGVRGIRWGVRQVGNGANTSILRPVWMHALHLPGGSKFDPPGSTRRWCCLSSPKSSAGNGEQGAVPLK